MADLKASLCGELPNQESVIPKEQLRNLLERRGIVGDPDIPNAKARLAEQELRRNSLEYVKVSELLQRFRDEIRYVTDLIDALLTVDTLYKQ